LLKFQSQSHDGDDGVDDDDVVLYDDDVVGPASLQDVPPLSPSGGVRVIKEKVNAPGLSALMEASVEHDASEKANLGRIYDSLRERIKSQVQSYSAQIAHLVHHCMSFQLSCVFIPSLHEHSLLLPDTLTCVIQLTCFQSFSGKSFLLGTLSIQKGALTNGFDFPQLSKMKAVFLKHITCPKEDLLMSERTEKRNPSMSSPSTPVSSTPQPPTVHFQSKLSTANPMTDPMLSWKAAVMTSVGPWIQADQARAAGTENAFFHEKIPGFQRVDVPRIISILIKMQGALREISLWAFLIFMD
jgi:hypothetical protein